MTSLTYTLSSLSEKLLPCPFCGSANVALGHDTVDGTYEIVCLGCAASLPAGDVTKEGAITQWIARSGRLRVSDELDAATVERCAQVVMAQGAHPRWERVASAIRSLIPNLQGEGEPVVKQVPSPAGAVSEHDERKELELRHGLREEDLP